MGSKRGKTRPSGVVVLNKPPGISSAQYVYRLRPVFGIWKVGHAGALDPFAEGVLLGCVGRATKLVERLMNLPKTYETTLQLGVTSPSYDPETPLEPFPNAKPPTNEQVSEAVRRFVGIIQQVPPAFSAVKVKGRSAYELARRGENVDVRARPVRIYRLEVLSYDWPLLTLRILCGRGTYIRALARDLGEALGCGAICKTLKRLEVGPFGIDRAVRLESARKEQIRSALIETAAVKQILERYRPPVPPIQPVGRRTREKSADGRE